MVETRTCPKCGAELSADAPAGICPKCLMQAGLESQATGAADSGTSSRPPVQPDFAPAATVPPSSRFPTPDLETLARQFPQLEILEHLGQGGMGIVYKARQRQLNRLVAVKILPPSVGDDPAFAERFTREAQALARLNHPNIVQVYDFGQTDEFFYFVMEYVDGLNLRALIRDGKLQPEEALGIVPQICEALQFAHDEGIVHRDIKPENILIDKKGRVKIADFGLAKLLGHAAGVFTLTGTDQVMGTLHYMAPEQLQQPDTVDHRADIYSLGVVFYEMLTGELPIGRFAPPSKKVQVDVRLDEVVLRSLETEPDRRYQHASEVKTDVETISSGPRPAAVPPSARESPETALAGKGQVTSPLGRLTQHWTGRLFLLAAAVVVGYAGYKSFLLGIGGAMFSLALVLCFLGFAVDVIRNRGNIRGLQAAFPLLAGSIALLIYLAAQPSPFLDWLYRVSGEKPGEGDSAFLRVIIGFIVVLLVWQMVEVYRKIAREDADNVSLTEL